MNKEATPPPPSPKITGSGPGTPPLLQTQPKRVALSWVCFLAVLAAVAVFQFVGDPGRILDAVIFAALGVVMGVQALKPRLLPMRRILPSWYGLTNRTVPASRAYGTRFDRISRAAVAVFLFYMVVTTPGIAGLFRPGR